MIEKATPQPRTAARKRTARRKRKGDPLPIQMGKYEYRKKGAARFDPRDPYHLALTLRWPHFFLAVFAIEIIINMIFALLYLLQPGSVSNMRPDSLADAFFFSLETLATVGYGAMAPQTFYGHAISAVEITCGMAFMAIMTGLIFVRFSRPKAKILYADRPVVTMHNGRPTLMVRVANGRMTLLTHVSARLSALVSERSAEGRFTRNAHDLRLMRARIPVFALTFTLMHVIDEESPLYGKSPEEMARMEMRIFLAIEAHDHALSAQVYALKDYALNEIGFGMRYVDAITLDDEGKIVADLTRLSLIEPDGIAGVSEAEEARDELQES